MRSRSSAEKSASSAPELMDLSKSSDTWPRVSLTTWRWTNGAPPFTLSFWIWLDRVVLISTSSGTPSLRQ